MVAGKQEIANPKFIFFPPLFLLPVATDRLADPILALASTPVGNLFIAESLASINLIGQARQSGVIVARCGTILTLAIPALWLWRRS